jgi:hypothetical protein
VSACLSTADTRLHSIGCKGRGGLLPTGLPAPLPFAPLCTHGETYAGVPLTDDLRGRSAGYSPDQTGIADVAAMQPLPGTGHWPICAPHSAWTSCPVLAMAYPISTFPAICYGKFMLGQTHPDRYFMRRGPFLQRRFTSSPAEPASAVHGCLVAISRGPSSAAARR